ncbi:hypothetical protein GCM10027021_09150 [Dyella kyungheensis]
MPLFFLWVYDAAAEGASWAMTGQLAPAMIKTGAEAGSVLRGMAVGLHVGS